MKRSASGSGAAEHRDRVLAGFQDFCVTPLADRRCRSTSVEEHVIGLFRLAAAGVPAYRQFLGEHGVDPEAIRNFADFQQLPLTDKSNYMRAFPLPQRCVGGSLDFCDTVAVSSGSTGAPVFWPRSILHELEIAARFEQVFYGSFRADERSSLAVICFALGTWVGGMFTANCCRYLAHKGYRILVVTPGSNKEEIFRSVEELGRHFDQVVLLGYPPFLKDVIDSGRARGLDWQSCSVKLVMAGEVFSEEWRSLVGERIGSSDPFADSASLYGTADAGVLGNETPLSICIRRYLAGMPDAARMLFGESRLPTLVQYDPWSRFFEAREGSLCFTGDNGVPLIRYQIGDSGGLVGFEEMLEFLGQFGFDPLIELGARGGRGVDALPFVYVFGRSDFTVSYFGANVFPENIAVGLEQPPIPKWVTGKFVLEVSEDEDRNRRLRVVVEALPGVTSPPDAAEAMARSIATHLRRLNSEFANYVPPEWQTPEVILAPAGDPAYFPPRVKHRYTRRGAGS